MNGKKNLTKINKQDDKILLYLYDEENRARVHSQCDIVDIVFYVYLFIMLMCVLSTDLQVGLNIIAYECIV